MKSMLKALFRRFGYDIAPWHPHLPNVWSNEPGFEALYTRISGHTLVPPERCFALHLNFVFTPPPNAEALAEADEAAVEMFAGFQHYVQVPVAFKAFQELRGSNVRVVCGDRLGERATYYC